MRYVITSIFQIYPDLIFINRFVILPNYFGHVIFAQNNSVPVNVFKHKFTLVTDHFATVASANLPIAFGQSSPPIA